MNELMISSCKWEIHFYIILNFCVFLIGLCGLCYYFDFLVLLSSSAISYLRLASWIVFPKFYCNVYLTFSVIYKRYNPQHRRVYRNGWMSQLFSLHPFWAHSSLLLHLETERSAFPRNRVYNQMLRWFPRFQVATTCFSRSPPDLNSVVTDFVFCIHVK